VSKEAQVKQLWQDALTGQISRREVMVRGTALGLSGLVLGALSQESIRGALAQDSEATSTFYSWMTDLHPGIFNVGEEVGVQIDIAPTTNFGFDRFVAEANEETSTWDLYGGVTPFLEMIALAESGTIEPWDQYLPEGVADNLFPATREEGTYNDQLYVWPFLLDIIVQGWNAKLVEAGGLDPEVAPANWDEFIDNAKTVQENGGATYGLVFDFHDWRSLLPITHSISTDVYTPDGLFMYTSDAAVEALEIMKRMMEWTTSDILSEGSTDGGVNATPDEQAFAAEQAAYYIKYQNAPLRMAAAWPDPSTLRLGTLPVQEGGVGGTVFWDTGIVLFTYGQNKEKAVEFVQALSNDEAIWQNSILGNPDEGTIPVGQLPIEQSIWEEWTANPPDWLEGQDWTFEIVDSLPQAKAIAPSILAVTQFDVARPEWIKYLSGDEADAKTALTKAWDAVAAEFEKQTGNAPQ
jgi:hypothetical protein